MGRRPPHHPRARAARERGIAVQALHRNIAAAELHYEQILVQIERAAEMIERDRAAGRDVGADEIRLGGLRVTLAEKRWQLESARHSAGFGDAA